MARVIAAVVLGTAFWVGVSLHDSSYRAKGKQAYLVERAEFFDKHIAPGHWRMTSCISAVAFVGAVVAVYEFSALGIYWAIRPRAKTGAA